MDWRLTLGFAIVMITGRSALADTTTVPLETAATIDDTDANSWSFSPSVATYLVPDDKDYVQPTLSVDYDWFHFEGRYNYEDLDTGSAWLGYNFSGGEKFIWEVTPIVGGVFGKTKGVAPGYEAYLSWWKLELYSEGEYVFDSEDSSASFFYNWSEFTLALTDWLRVGMVTQRTKVRHEDRDISRGPMLGITYKQLDLTGYIFDPDENNPTFVTAAALEF